MFNFSLKKTAVYQALKWEKLPLFKLAGIFTKIFFYLFVLCLFLFALFFIFQFLSSYFFLGLSIILLTVVLFFWQVSLFFETEVKSPEIEIPLSEALVEPQRYNLAEFLDFEAAKSIRAVIRFCKKRKINKISSTILFYSLLKESKIAQNLFWRLGLKPEDFQERLKNYIEKERREKRASDKFSQDFQKTIIEAAKTAQKRKKKDIRISPREILVGLSKHNPFFKDFLIKAEEFKEKDIENITRWSDYLERRKKERKKFWTKKNLSKHGSIGKDWASGYTITLDQFSIDWRDIVSTWYFKEIVGHGKEIKKIERVLTRSKINNALVVGSVGTGRKSIIQSLAQRIYQGRSLPNLNHKRMVELDLVSLLSQITDPEEVEATLDKIFQEVVKAGNVILIIDEFHKYVLVETFRPGAIDISGIIARYLQYPQFCFIGITTFTGLHKRIEQNPSLLELFEKVEVTEVSDLETIRILENMALSLEQKYDIFVTYPAVRKIVELSENYLPNLPFPKKAIDILEVAAAYIASKKDQRIILPSHIEEILSERTEIPIGKVREEEKKILLNLESLIHRRIINQNEAVAEISTSLRRARAEITPRERPMGVFLFLGPTGVGKTETSKVLADIYFEGEENMTRLDMSEFQEVSDIPRLIGSEGEIGLLTTPARENPFSLILLDEIEKAYPNILNLFLQVFDEGSITDGQGRKVSFMNTIIICTSNAGSEIIWKDVKQNKELNTIKDDLLGFFFEKGIFRPEFINRFDATVIFKPLSKKSLLGISQLMLNSLKKNLKEKGIEFEVTEPLKEKIVDLSYNPAFGAREMRRVIQNKVSNILAQALLSDEIKRGDKVEIDPKKFELIINKS